MNKIELNILLLTIDILMVSFIHYLSFTLTYRKFPFMRELNTSTRFIASSCILVKTRSSVRLRRKKNTTYGRLINN